MKFLWNQLLNKLILWFYVKSNTCNLFEILFWAVWKILYVSVTQLLQEIIFGSAKSSKNTIFYCRASELTKSKFQPLIIAKIHQNRNSELLNMSNVVILDFKNHENWFHVKSEWWQKNPEIVTLCNSFFSY